MTSPQHKITVTHDGSDIAFEGLTFASDVWLRENKGSNANLGIFDEFNGEQVYLNLIEQGDVIQVEYKKDASDAGWSQVFGGYTVELTPQLSESGRILPTKAYGYDIAFDRMRAALECGNTSNHPTLNTPRKILTDSTYGLVSKYTQKVLASAIDSGYNFNTDYVVGDGVITLDLPYMLFPYASINDCFKTILDLTAAARWSSTYTHLWEISGYHYFTKAEGTTAYLLMAPVGLHNVDGKDESHIVESKWPTVCPVSIVYGVNPLSITYSKQQMEANYIVYFGKYEFPQGEFITEDAAANWANYSNPALSITDDNSDFKVGSNCVHWDLGAAGATNSIYYFPLPSLDISKIGTKRTVPTVSFYVKPTNMQSLSLILGTGSPLTNYFTRPISLPSDNTWGTVEVSLGQYIKAGQEDSWAVGGGSPSWNDLDYVALNMYRPALGQSDLRLDNMLFNGIVTRGAYHSDSGPYKIKLITDSLAKTTNLLSSSDEGTVAQLAKADLLRAMTTPTFAHAKILGLEPSIMPGQMTSYDGVWWRITEVHFHLGENEAYTELELTDDLLNSYPAENTSFGPTAQYNSIMKAVNPDFQDRDRGNLKGRDIDIDQTILAVDYA